MGQGEFIVNLESNGACEVQVDKSSLNRIEYADGLHIYRACGDKHHPLAEKKCHCVMDVDFSIPDE